ncbi:DNA polymerase subunit gamma-2, mitochondrial [Spodoptera litura]|uniref:DNA polymerase subunit gamma-2, mitochondrial n=1 Tax=Spodoptera litura TaxID=69820 RepID=A0A9J7EMI8_SPOLT|nr:DNA polymerase subunit gamma-2, mitochondrial [Spodoptera litura]
MKIEVERLAQMRHFFNILQISDKSVKITLNKPSKLLMKNIHTNWLKYNHVKADKHQMPVFLNYRSPNIAYVPSVYGVIKQDIQNYTKDMVLEMDLNTGNPLKKSMLRLDLFIPQEEAMQYLIQWQRYRKYWWSSISTTPSLFCVNDFNYQNNTAHVEIVAQFPNGHQTVESLSCETHPNHKYGQLSCTLCLENALLVLLLDGLSNSQKDEYLRLHRKIAPFKVSIALKLDKEKEMDNISLHKMATLLHYKLLSNNISTWLPDHSLPLDLQIKENCQMGVTYTGILEEETLKFGFLKLMSNSTKLTEQVHLKDFCKYASLKFRDK